MDIETVKLLCLGGLVALSLIGGLAPYYYNISRPSGANSLWLSLGNVFSAGVFLGGALLHLLPEALEVGEDLQSSLGDFPILMTLTGLGFISLLMIEKVMMSCICCTTEKPDADVEVSLHSLGANDLLTSLNPSPSLLDIGSIEHKGLALLHESEEHQSEEHHASDDHGHSHGGGAISAATSPLTAYVMVFALSFHTIFEGIAFGTQQSISATISIFIAIAAHTPLAGFALGVSLAKSKARRSVYVGCIVTFSVIILIGGGIGMGITEALKGSSMRAASAIFQSFSAGTFLYISIYEILPKEMERPGGTTAKLFLLLLGFGLMVTAKALEADHEEEEN